MAIKNKTVGRDELIDIFIEQELSGAELDRALDAVDRINRLKREKNAVILAHYYMRDGIKFGIADYVGDSLDLSRAAVETDAQIIVFCGVHFMAETAKILNPDKTVLLPDLEAGCSLAESITPADVRKLREQYPDAAFVTYVNTGAAIKAECDICVTSANAPCIIRALPERQIVFMPDRYMGANLKAEITEKEMIVWDGTCVVHEQFTPGEIRQYRREYPGLHVLAHYECPEEVIAVSDMHGGTGDMRRYVREVEAPAYLLGTECGLASTIKAEFPDKNVLGPCNLCPYMKKIDVLNTLRTLETGQPEITVPEDVRVRARRAVDRMLAMS